jgi:hypothetical protein
MGGAKWERLILSDLEHDHLVAELNLGDQFILLLDREQGRDALGIAFPDRDGKLGERVPLSEFMTQLAEAAEDLKR